MQRELFSAAKQFDRPSPEQALAAAMAAYPNEDAYAIAEYMAFELGGPFGNPDDAIWTDEAMAQLDAEIDKWIGTAKYALGEKVNADELPC